MYTLLLYISTHPKDTKTVIIIKNTKYLARTEANINLKTEKKCTHTRGVERKQAAAAAAAFIVVTITEYHYQYNTKEEE